MDDIRSRKFLTDIDPAAFETLKMEKWCQEVADERLAAQGLVVDDKSRRKLAVAVGAAVQRASLSLARLAKGEVLGSAVLFPTHSMPSTPADTKPLTFKFLVDGWSTERRPVSKTVYEWSRVVRQLEKYLGHDDTRRLTGEDLVGRESSMVAAGLRPKTIQDAKLAPVRAILHWGLAPDICDIGSVPIRQARPALQEHQRTRTRSEIGAPKESYDQPQ
jgi:hypothetical protein